MLTCPVSQAVWQWFAATWTAVAQQWHSSQLHHVTQTSCW
jgi:hypothetical protein